MYWEKSNTIKKKPYLCKCWYTHSHFHPGTRKSLIIMKLYSQYKLANLSCIIPEKSKVMEEEAIVSSCALF